MVEGESQGRPSQAVRLTARRGMHAGKENVVASDGWP